MLRGADATSLSGKGKIDLWIPLYSQAGLAIPPWVDLDVFKCVCTAVGWCRLLCVRIDTNHEGLGMAAEDRGLAIAIWEESVFAPRAVRYGMGRSISA